MTHNSSQQNILPIPDMRTLNEVPIVSFPQNPCFIQTAQEKLKDLLSFHAKVSQLDFEKFDPQIVKDINAHVRVIDNLLNISKFQVNDNSFQNKSSENPNKIINKQFDSILLKRKMLSILKKNSSNNLKY